MCGIAGIASPEPLDERASQAVKRMCDAMAHRGPDGEGLWRSPSSRCMLGHRRLVVLDPSPAAAQPMVSGSFALTYNGEVYNFRELRHALERSGRVFRSSGDTEVVLHWLAERKAAGLSALHGMFAFALWNESERTLLLARDPLGIKPLYWTRIRVAGAEAIIFASELRAIVTSRLVDRRISAQALHDYLAYGSVPGPRTLIEGVSELPPGSCLVWSPEKQCEPNRYWYPRYPRNGDRPADPGALREELHEAVASQLVSDVPLGAFLSGGIDSSAVVSTMAKVAPGRVRTLSVVFPDHAGIDESRFARQVAEACHTDHREVAVSDAEIPGVVAAALKAMDQPSIDGLNTFIVSRAARETGLTVALSGLGGDEIFGGYPSFRDVPKAALWLRRLGSGGRFAAREVLRLVAASRGPSRILHKLVELSAAEPTILGVYRARRRLFSEPQIAELLGDRVGTRASDERWDDLDHDIEGLAAPDAVSWLEMRTYMANTLLRDSDVMGMANGLEIRLPLLHMPFAELAQRCGPSVRGSREPKQTLVDAALADLAGIDWQRPKQGFELPMVSWMLETSLRERIDIVLDASAPCGARRLWGRFLEAPSAIGWSRPWALFALEGWKRTVLADAG